MTDRRPENLPRMAKAFARVNAVPVGKKCRHVRRLPEQSCLQLPETQLSGLVKKVLKRLIYIRIRKFRVDVAQQAQHGAEPFQFDAQGVQSPVRAHARQGIRAFADAPDAFADRLLKRVRGHEPQVTEYSRQNRRRCSYSAGRIGTSVFGCTMGCALLYSS